MRERLLPFTEIHPCQRVHEKGDTTTEYEVFLRVGDRPFCVTTYPCETLARAEWVREQLIVALEQMMRQLTGEGVVDGAHGVR